MLDWYPEWQERSAGAKGTAQSCSEGLQATRPKHQWELFII
jgi:hypothetical protein